MSELPVRIHVVTQDLVTPELDRVVVEGLGLTASCTCHGVPAYRCPRPHDGQGMLKIVRSRVS